MIKADAIHKFMNDMNKAGMKTRIIYPQTVPGVKITPLISMSDITKATRLPVTTVKSRMGEIYCILDAQPKEVSL